MKTWEMIKTLSENPKLKFVTMKNMPGEKVMSVIDGSYLFFERFRKIGDKFDFDTPAGGFNGNVNLDDEWELVREPVDFMTAVKAFHNDKKITCQGCKSLTLDPRTYDPNNDVYEHCLIDTEGDPVSSHEILNGQWYIED